MSLNPDFSDVDASAKLTFNINAFNGNTTNFNRACPKPKSTVSVPVQPLQEVPSFSPNQRLNAGKIMPM